MMTRMLVALLGGLSLGLAQAGQPINERAAADPDATVIVKNVKGEIQVEGWDRDEVHLTGELGDGSKELVFTTTGRQIRVEVQIPRRANNVEESVLYLRVPQGASVDVESVSARIGLRNLAGESVRATSVSGEVEVDARVAQTALKSVSGDIEFRGESRRTELESVSGDIDVDGVSGELRVNTVSGEVLMNAAQISDARFESVSGDVEIEGSLADGAQLVIESLSGDVDLNLPSNPSVRCDVETFSGSIRSDQGEVKSARHGPHKSLNFVTGSGDARIRIESFSGDVRIRTAN